MNEIFNLLITIVAIGVVSLFATFFIILGLQKKEVWKVIWKRISFDNKKGE